MRTRPYAVFALLATLLPLACPGLPIPIDDVIGIGTAYQDSKLGLSVTCPPLWRVLRSTDQGRTESSAGAKISVSFARLEPKPAVVLMQYQPFGPNTPDPKDAEAHYREEAKRRTTQRVAAGDKDYRLVPERIRYRTVDGRRIVSLLTLFTAPGNSSMAEYHVHVLGKSGVATFSMTAPAANVEAALADIDQMAETAAVP